RHLGTTLVDLGLLAGGGVDDREVGAGLAADPGEVGEDGLLGEPLHQASAGRPAGEAGGDHGPIEDLQRPGDVDPLAAGDGAPLDGAMPVALVEAGDGDRAVDRGVEGDREDHPAPPLRCILSRRRRIRSWCILVLSSGVRCLGPCRPLRRTRGMTAASPVGSCLLRLSSTPTTITIATRKRRKIGFLRTLTTLSKKVAAPTDSDATSGLLSAGLPSTVTVTRPRIWPCLIAPLTSPGACTRVPTCCPGREDTRRARRATSG